MGESTKIEWCDHSFNPWHGCTKVSAGCLNCYAERISHRNPGVLGVWGDGGTRVVASEAMWREPFRWDRKARDAGERRRVFCASIADVFEDRTELARPRARMLATMAATPNLDYLLLTKRPENWARLIRQALDAWPVGMNGRKRDGAYWWACDWLHGKAPANIWSGASVEDQARADERIPELLKIPAAVRFLSCEPLLGPLDLSPWLECPECRGKTWDRVDVYSIPCPVCDGDHRGIDWVICGGESGPGARPMHPDWARSLRDQCAAAGVAFHFKQWGEWQIIYDRDVDDPDWRACPRPKDDRERYINLDGGHGFHGERVCFARRVGKKAAGRLLDGREWSEFPEPKGVAR